jgi:hypothetical protein
VAYAVELYAAPEGGLLADDQLAAAGAQLRAEGQPIQFLGSVAIPGDEMVFWLFDAPSREVVSELLRRVRVVPERIVEAVASAASPRPDGG